METTDQNSLGPLIINNSLLNQNLMDYLDHGFKIRRSSTTFKDSVILPRSNVAVLILYLDKINFRSKDTDSELKADLEMVEDLQKRIQNFCKNHQGYLIATGSTFGEEEIEFITSSITIPLLPRSLPVLLAHGDAQTALHIKSLAKATDVAQRPIVKERMQEIKKKSMKIDLLSHLARSACLSSHDISILTDIYGNIQNIAKASETDLQENTPLESATASSLYRFLHQDTAEP